MDVDLGKVYEKQISVEQTFSPLLDLVTTNSSNTNTAQAPNDNNSHQKTVLSDAQDNMVKESYRTNDQLIHANNKEIKGVTKVGFSPLHKACKSGETRVAQQLIEHGADVNSIDYKDKTPLHYSCEKGHTEIAAMLLKKGALVNTQEVAEVYIYPPRLGLSPLHSACIEGHRAIVELLIENGARVNMMDVRHQTPLNYSCGKGHISIVDLLLKNGALVNAKDKNGSSPLHSASAAGHTDVAELLIENGADIQAERNDQWTPLRCACANGHTNTISSLLSKGAVIHGQDFYSACRNGHLNVVQLLLQSGGDMNLDLQTALYQAAESRSIPMISFLIVMGAAVDMETLQRGWLGESNDDVEPILNNAKFFQQIILSYLRIKSYKGLSACLNYYKASTRSVLCWKTLTRTDEFMTSMKQLFYSESSLDRKIFFRCLMYFLDFLKSSASKNEAERSELEAILTEFELAIEKFFSADYFDEPAHVIELLFMSESPETPFMFDPEECLIGYSLEIGINILFNNATIVNTLHKVFKFYPMRWREDTSLIAGLCGFNREGLQFPIYHRFCPRNMIILDIACRSLILSLIGSVSIEYGSLHGLHYSSAFGVWSDLEVTLAVVYSSVVIHEIGEVIDAGWNIAGYFSDSWNVFDSSSTILGLLWLIARIESNNPALIRVSLALQAIPEAIGLLRFLSINQALGELVIMVRAMMSELVYFIVMYLVSLVGFCICLRGLFFGDDGYSSNSTTALSVFSIAFGNFDFYFSSSNQAVNVVGTLLIVIIIILSSVLLLNLLIAQMTNSYQRVKDQSFRAWAFSYAAIVKQSLLLNDMNVMTMLPAPLNLIPIMLCVPHYLVICCTPVNVASTKSIAGTVINYFFALMYSPLYHMQILMSIPGLIFRSLEFENVYYRFALGSVYILLLYSSYPILWIIDKLLWLGSAERDYHFEENYYDYMEQKVVNEKLVVQHSNKVFHLWSTESRETIFVYYTMPKSGNEEKLLEQYVFEPITDILFAKAAITSDIHGPLGSLGTEIRYTKNEMVKELNNIDENMRAEFQWMKEVMDKCQSSDEKLSHELQSVHDRVSSLESKLDLVLTLLQREKS